MTPREQALRQELTMLSRQGEGGSTRASELNHQIRLEALQATQAAAVSESAASRARIGEIRADGTPAPAPAVKSPQPVVRPPAFDVNVYRRRMAEGEGSAARYADSCAVVPTDAVQSDARAYVATETQARARESTANARAHLRVLQGRNPMAAAAFASRTGITPGDDDGGGEAA